MSSKIGIGNFTYYKKHNNDCPAPGSIKIDYCRKNAKKFGNKKFCQLHFNSSGYGDDKVLDKWVACINNNLDIFLQSKKIKLTNLYEDVIKTATAGNYREISSLYSKKSENKVGKSFGRVLENHNPTKTKKRSSAKCYVGLFSFQKRS